jgi:hypothetical protein
MKKQKKVAQKLQLPKETLRVLENVDARVVAGVEDDPVQTDFSCPSWRCPCWTV